MSSLFDPDIVPPDEEFGHLRDEPRFEEERIYVDSLWDRYEPYADPHFKSEISTQFHERFWEMYLGCALMDQGHTIIQQSGTEHPDVCLSWNGSRIWVEATAPGPGHGNDAIPRLPKAEPLPGLPFSKPQFFSIPDEKVILRYTSAIFTKVISQSSQYRSYLNKGIISSSEPYILAINGRNVPFTFADEIPTIVQAVFPVGPLTALIDWDRPENVETFYSYRSEVKKSTGTIPIGFPSEISGIVFSQAHAWRVDKNLGSDFIFVRNPEPSNPLPKSWVSVGYEFRLEQKGGQTYVVKEKLGKQS